MSTFSTQSVHSLRLFARALPTVAWGVALFFCAWVMADLFWQFAAPSPVAAIAQHEPDARKVATRIGLRFERNPLQPVAAGSEQRQSNEPRYTVLGIATGFGALPGFVLLQADDGTTLNLSPGQALPDGRMLARLHPEAAEFERNGLVSRLALQPRGGN